MFCGEGKYFNHNKNTDLGEESCDQSRGEKWDTCFLGLDFWPPKIDTVPWFRG